MSREYLTTVDVARELGCAQWQLWRIETRGLTPPVQRVGRNRVYTRADLPAVRRALRAAGYLK